MSEAEYQHRVITGLPLFQWGDVIATEEVATSILETTIKELVVRHTRGDFGILDAADCEANHKCIETGRGQILSAYMVGKDKIYVITDDGHLRTTVLFSHEY